MESNEFTRLDTKLEIIIKEVGSQARELAVIKTALAGYNGQDGLIRKLEATCARQDDHEKNLNRLTRFVWVLAALSVGSSGTTILKLLLG